MSFSPATFHTIFNFTELMAQLEQGCAWAQIDRGRATLYGRLVAEFFNGAGNSQEHVLAYYEAMDIAEIYKLWARSVMDFPGLKEKICETLKSGPLIQDHENPASSNNRPRNDAFAFFIAGRMLAAGCEVLAVDGINRFDETGPWFGDVTVRRYGTTLDVQCKRPQSSDSVDRNVEKARKQILRTASPRVGIIAIDASVIIRPRGTLLSANSAASASAKLSGLIQPHAESVATTMITPQIAGLIWFGRLPCMITESSRIIRSTGGRYEITRPYSAAEIALNPNHLSPLATNLIDIGRQLKRWREATRPN